MTKMQVFLCAMEFRIIPEVTGELLNLGTGQEVTERQRLERLSMKSDLVYVDFLASAMTFYFLP